MEPTARSLDLRQTRPSVNRSTSAIQAPAAQRTHHLLFAFCEPNYPLAAPPTPSLTTEYTPMERGGPAKPQAPTPVPQQQTPQPQPQPLQRSTSESESRPEGPDPNSLPPATAPPSHPHIDPTAVGSVDGRSILEVDLNALSDKPWRRPGSDISDWFNYGFDEISWEAYCYRRKEVGDVAGVLKTNVVVRNLILLVLHFHKLVIELCWNARRTVVSSSTGDSIHGHGKRNHVHDQRWC